MVEKLMLFTIKLKKKTNKKNIKRKSTFSALKCDRAQSTSIVFHTGIRLNEIILFVHLGSLVLQMWYNEIVALLNKISVCAIDVLSFKTAPLNF